MRFFLLLCLSSLSIAAIDLGQVEQDLKGPGIIGEVHGATEDLGLYVLTYRNPGDFFDHYEFPLTTKDAGITATLKSLGRHDKVKVKGLFITNKAPVKHIDVTELSVVTKFEDGMNVPKYQHKAQFPKDLETQTELIGKVHAVAEEGKILVIEYKDGVIPVYVPDPTLTKNLFRNDKIKIKYRLKTSPAQPTHVILNNKLPDSIKVMDKMVDWHGKEGFIEGNLILFPKSPQVKFNVFALQNFDADGVERDFTLVNFDDPKAFEAIRNKLQDVWDKKPGNIQNARNKYVNLNVVVKGTGTFNVVDPGQANPQILLKSPDSITITKGKN